MNLLRPGSGFGMAGWRLVCAAVALALWRPAESCPAGCTCTGFRIYCADTERGIAAFPELSEPEMENVTDIYIANQSNFSSINDKDLTFYRNLRNLSVTNTRLTYVSRQAFQNNVKLQYLNLKDNNLSSLSWKTVHHLNLSYLVLSGNPLQCSCENMWMKQGRGDESEAAELMCVEEGGKRRHLSKLILPNCVVPTVSLHPKSVTLMAGSNVTLACNASGMPTPDLNWITCPLNSSYEIVTSGQSSILRLRDLSSLDNDCKITCSSDNTAGEGEASLKLNILFAPTISKLMDAISDHHWCIPFSVSGNPCPELRWLLRGEPLTEGTFISTRFHDYSEHEYHGCLQLDNPTHINNGEYTLLASNPYGSDRKAVFVHFMHNPWNDSTATDSLYYDPTTDDTPLEPPEDRVAVYVVVGIAAVTFTGFVLMLVVLKFGRNSKFGIKDQSNAPEEETGLKSGHCFVLFHNVPVEVVSR